MDIAAPLWVVVLVAALGVAGTLVAALAAQALTTRREGARARAEAATLVDAAHHERARDEQRRADDAEAAVRDRLLAERRTAYAELLVSIARWHRYIGHKRDQRLARNGGAVPVESGPYADAVDRAYAAVQIVGDSAVLEAAGKAYHNLLITVVHLEATHFSVNRVDEGRELVDAHVGDFLAAVRSELGIDPATPLTA